MSPAESISQGSVLSRNSALEFLRYQVVSKLLPIKERPEMIR